MIYGTLDTLPATAAEEAAAGVGMAMLELSWGTFQPGASRVNAAYIKSKQSDLLAYQAAGMAVTLALGTYDPPGWAFRLPDSHYAGADGSKGSDLCFVFSAAVRAAAAAYFKLISQYFPLTQFTAIRLTSGGNGEMLYPDGDTYWAFSPAALGGNGLPAGMKPNPHPRWKPGRTGLSPGALSQWVNWYVSGLAGVTTWQMQVLGGIGFTGTYQTVTPGSGTRPDDLAQAIAGNLAPDGTTNVGAVWDRYYAMLPAGNIMAYISSVADLSGGDDTTQPGDITLPLTDPDMDSWSATRWITRIAAGHGLSAGGENPGYGQPESLNAHYTDTSQSGMMAAAMRQAKAAGFAVFYWAHDYRLWDGTLPFALYASSIAGQENPPPA